MLLYITARRMRMTPPIRGYIEDRLVRSVEKHAGNVTVVRMEVQLYRPSNRELRYGCHVLLHLPEKAAINIREEAGDLYEAIDLADKGTSRALVDHIERRDTLARFPVKYYAAKLELGEYEILQDEVAIEEDELGRAFEGEQAGAP